MKRFSAAIHLESNSILGHIMQQYEVICVCVTFTANAALLYLDSDPQKQNLCNLTLFLDFAVFAFSPVHVFFSQVRP